MKRSIMIICLATTPVLFACEKKNEAAAPPQEAAAAAPAEPGAANAAPQDAAARQSATQALQAQLDGLATKVEALKANPKFKDKSAALTDKLDAARTELKALGSTTDATWNEAKAKAQKTVQELEAAIEQAGAGAVD